MSVSAAESGLAAPKQGYGSANADTLVKPPAAGVPTAVSPQDYVFRALNVAGWAILGAYARIFTGIS